MVLGEFLDDFDFGKNIADYFGLPTNENKSADVVVGEDRLSNGHTVFGSLGITFILVSILFIAFILLLVLAI